MSDRLVLGLTGGIATGKSTVAAMFRERGCPVIDSDVIAREIVEPGKPAWEEIGKKFGSGIYTDSGELNRKTLGSIIFKDPGARAELNRITHPRIVEEIQRRIAQFKRGDRDPRKEVDGFRSLPVVADIPLLYEGDLGWLVDKVVLVYASPHIQIRRLMERDGLSRQEAILRINSQMPVDDKRKLADYVIDNGGDIERTRRQFEDLWKELRRYQDSSDRS